MRSAFLFHAAFYEVLARRIASAPRAVAAGLVALCALASPGVVRIGVAGPRPATAGGDVLLVELGCDAGVWSAACLEEVDSLTHELLRARDLVQSVDSLTTRPRVLWTGRELALAPLVGAPPSDAVEERRLRGRAEQDRAALRGLVAPDERAALVQVRLRAGASAADVHALALALRRRFDRPPALALATSSDAVAERSLELAAGAGARRAVPAVLAGLALLAALACGSASLGLAVGALAALALLSGAGSFALAGLPIGAGAALLPALVGAAMAGSSFALLHRLRAEERAGARREQALPRALGAVGPGLFAAGLGAAASCAALACAVAPARGLALAAALGLLAALALALVGLPALLFARAGRRAPLRTNALGLASEGALAQLDLASRAHGLRRNAGWIALGLAALWAVSAVRALRADASDAALLAGTREQADVEQLARDFGGTALLRVELDSGARGGALEPLFLERALGFERACARETGVAYARSLLDAALLPAMRATHDDDPGFAIVPPTRAQVVDALAPFARAAPEQLAHAIDADEQRLAIELLADLRGPEDAARLAAALQQHAAASFGHAGALSLPSELAARLENARSLRSGTLWAALGAIAAIAAIAALALESTAAGALAAVPAACAALAVLGALGALGIALGPTSSALPALVAGAAAAPALFYLARVRELRAAGAELGVAVSLALRDAGRPIFEGAVAGLWCLALLSACSPHLRTPAALACVGSVTGSAAALGLLPAWVRALRPVFPDRRSVSPVGETLSCVRDANREQDGDAGHG